MAAFTKPTLIACKPCIVCKPCMFDDGSSAGPPLQSDIQDATFGHTFN